MKKKTIYALALCAVLFLAVGQAPIQSDTTISRPRLGKEEDSLDRQVEPPSYRVYVPIAIKGAAYVFLQSWGNEIGVFYSPSGIAVSGDRVYVCERGGNRIQVFDVHGKPLTTFGELGSGEGQFDSPRGVAADGSGNVYVADTWNHRIQKFTSDGTYLAQWGSEGSGDGQFNMPGGIAVDGSGNVYVADAGNEYTPGTGNHRVQKFTADGTYLTQWGSEGSGEGQFNLPYGIAVDGSGNVYVTDGNNHRIQKFTSDGTYLTQWGSEGSGEGQFNWPWGIGVDRSGNVYVVERENHRVQKFTSDGTYLTQWGGSGSGDGQFHFPEGVAVDGSGNVYVADAGNGFWAPDTSNHRVQKFTSDGTYLTQWGSQRSGDGQFKLLEAIAVDGSGNVYVADAGSVYWPATGNHRVQKFTSDGTYLTQWGSFGSGEGRFYWPRGIAVDGSGNVYVADTGNDRVQKFTSDGTYLTQWGGSGSGEVQFSSPEGIAVDGSGNVYVADRGGNRIQKFTSDGMVLIQWGSYGSGEGQFNSPRGVAADGSGNVYVADTENDRVQKFTSDGTYLTQWGGSGSGEGQFSSPEGIAVDGSGNVYVADRGGNRIQKFTSDGTYLTQWGSFGSGEGRFYWPRGIAVDGSGNVYVADTGNDRVQKFAPGYPAPDPVHGLALNGSFEETPNLVRWTYGGELPVGLVHDAFDGTYAAQLGEPTPQTGHDEGMAWLRQTMYIRPEWDRPVLTFHYRMFVNDIMDYSDFHVWLTRSNGAWLAEIVRDGFRSCHDPPQAPPAGYDLGWRTATYDLSAFKGQSVRLVFENRNLHGGMSWGIWTVVDDVRVVDAGPLPTPPGPPRAYLPAIMNGYTVCDPVVGGLGVESAVRPVRP